jgi:hypothetical protein
VLSCADYVSAKIEEDQYVAVGFHGVNYFDFTDYMTKLRPNYFGMQTDPMDELITDRIALGYSSGGLSGGCLREMKSDGYVGEPVDVDPAKKIFTATEARRVNGRTVLHFTVSQFWGNDTAAVSTQMTNEMRVMWAIGSVTKAEGDGAAAAKGCDAQIGFHSKHRGVSPQFWFYVRPQPFHPSASIQLSLIDLPKLRLNCDVAGVQQNTPCLFSEEEAL